MLLIQDTNYFLYIVKGSQCRLTQSCLQRIKRECKRRQIQAKILKYTFSTKENEAADEDPSTD